MKRIALLAVIGAGLMALPSTAAAQSGTTCSGPPNSVQVIVGPPPMVYACVYEANTGYGGEVKLNGAGCSYINGWSTNPEQARGYAGICTGAVSRGPGCNPDGHASGANTGGCFAIKGDPLGINDELNTFPVGLVTASFICGNTTGENPQSSERRGCAIP